MIYSLDNPETKIFVGDCRDRLKYCNGVNLIFADPPFNWQIPYADWDDGMPRDAYLAFTREWLELCYDALVFGGALWVNIPDDTAAEIVIHLKSLGMCMRNWCIWHFRFGQCVNSKFIISKTHLLYFLKVGNIAAWNPQDILEDSDRATKYNDWRTEITKSPGKRVPLDVWYGENMGRIQGNNLERRELHPNQIPELILARIIKACTNEGDLVLDPFCGSGTTSTVARALSRRSITIEINPEYAKSAFERIKKGAVRV